jgi:hypothetical protein
MGQEIKTGKRRESRRKKKKDKRKKTKDHSQCSMVRVLGKKTRDSLADAHISAREKRKEGNLHFYILHLSLCQIGQKKRVLQMMQGPASRVGEERDE